MEYLEKTFRWFGPDFGVSLRDIRQTGATGIVTALHHIPTGEVWSSEEIRKRKEEIEAAGLKWSVVESVNVHESIKIASDNRSLYLENYIKTLENLAAAGIYVVCYNFMPVLDWTRTNLNYTLEDGTSSLFYDPLAVTAFDLYILKRKAAENEYSVEIKSKAKAYLDSLDSAEVAELQRTIMAGLPGTRDVFTIEEFQKHLDTYHSIDRETLRENLAFFLQTVIPEAERLGIRMCIHPDDPPYSILGLPRVVSTKEDIAYLLNCAPSYSNGLTYCTGSLGASRDNNLVEIFKAFADKVHFLHLRSVNLNEDNSFFEADHLQGTAPMSEIMTAIVEEQVRRKNLNLKDISIPMRPDHGHLMLDDLPRLDAFYPGYSTLGRMKGLAELTGLEKGIRHHILREVGQVGESLSNVGTSKK